ncbi:hypothetical protein MK489_09520 [Myxococcota bacterium]|nr:hypothetical protein [Myxococcota bacterium]
MSVLIGIGSLAVLSVLALRVYDFLSGRRFILDQRDKFRLDRRSLVEWDRHCTQNTRISDLIVCLTTTPSRIGHLEGTLKSLMAQRLRPRTIRLHLPEFSAREDCAYVIPESIAHLENIEIVRCEDEGPATKLLSALRDQEPDQPILVVDDDMLYPERMVEAFDEAARREPTKAFTLSGWIVPEDLTDRATTLMGNILQRPPVPLKCTRISEPRRIDIFQGYAGFLVRPRFFDLADTLDYSGAPSQARTVDDVWLSGHCLAPKFVLPHDRYPFEFGRDSRHFAPNALGRLNRGGGDPAERSNTIVVRHLRDRWMVTGDPA